MRPGNEPALRPVVPRALRRREGGRRGRPAQTQKYGEVKASNQMAKFDGIVEKRLLTVTEKENEITLVFEDNRYLFVSLKDGKVHSESVPE